MPQNLEGAVHVLLEGLEVRGLREIACDVDLLLGLGAGGDLDAGDEREVVGDAGLQRVHDALHRVVVGQGHNAYFAGGHQLEQLLDGEFAVREGRVHVEVNQGCHSQHVSGTEKRIKMSDDRKTIREVGWDRGGGSGVVVVDECNREWDTSKRGIRVASRIVRERGRRGQNRHGSYYVRCRSCDTCI